MKRLAATLVLMVQAILAQGADSTAGAACVPTGQTIAAATNFNSAGDAKFSATKVGQIILTCPVASTVVSASALGVTYRDADGPASGAQVTASLREKDLTSAAVRDVGIARLNSNSFPATSAYRTMWTNIAAGGCGEFTFNHASKVYYIQVVLNRSTVTQEAIVASVSLSTPVC
jgi:hypothetical protein